jgi:protein SCO1/2
MRIVLLALVLLAAAAHAADGRLKAGTFDPPRLAPDFTLDGSDGRALKLSGYRGKVVMLGFGFTNCPEVCPTTLSRLARAKKKLGDGGRDLQVVYVTVDPARDNPERMRTYLTRFEPSFIGGTGTQQQLDKVQKEYGIHTALKLGQDPANYAFDHSSFVYLIDRAGSLRALMPYGRSADDFAHDAAILLAR